MRAIRADGNLQETHGVSRRFRRRRRGPGLSPRTLLIAAGLGVVALIGAIVWLGGVAERGGPPPTETRVALPDALKERPINAPAP